MRGSKILFNSSTIEIEFKFFFFFLRIEIDIFRHETNLTSETWQTFFFHFDSGPRMHVKRQNCIRWEAKKFSNKSAYGWNHDTSPVILGLRVLFWFQYRHEGFGTVCSPSRLSTSARDSPYTSQDLHSILQLRLVSLPRIYVISELPTVRDEPFHKHESFVTQVE